MNRREFVKISRELLKELYDDHEEHTGVTSKAQMSFARWQQELANLYHNTRAIADTQKGVIYTDKQVTVAPPYDVAVLDHVNEANPRSIVYDLDTGFEVATFPVTDRGQIFAEKTCEFLNSLVAEEGLADGPQFAGKQG